MEYLKTWKDKLGVLVVISFHFQNIKEKIRLERAYHEINELIYIFTAKVSRSEVRSCESDMS